MQGHLKSSILTEKHEINFFSYQKDTNDINSSAFELKEQTPQQKKFVEVAREEGAKSEHVLNLLVNPLNNFELLGNDLSQTVSENESEGEPDLVNTSETKKVTGIGLNNASQLVRLLCRIFDIPDSMTYYPYGSSTKSLEN